ncbi:hypothetical protein DM860_010790 [Cuscuta australis]|uniref:Clathrin light chain n=1 Tax=Cuscuta australis TaxID=267555 RepID=A0A328E3P1_9ASTE|nr:hypothetical protein DM860_010790 [Cuscuta australis]
MTSSYHGSFDQPGGAGGFSYPPLSSQRFESFPNFADSESGKYQAAGDDSPFFVPQHLPSPPQIYSSGGGLGSDPADFSTLQDEKPFDDGFPASNGPILPPPPEIQEEGFALREWRRQNAIQLEKKEKREKELLGQIIDEADSYKVQFYKKRQLAMEANKAACREKERLFIARHEKLNAEADKHYWKAIAELIPNEVPTMEKKGKKSQEKNPAVAITIKGPKPGKPTELSRMRQIVLKLKHNTPPHLMLAPPTATNTTKDAKSGTASPIAIKPIAVA